MSKRIGERVGYSLLGAAMVAIGVLANLGDVENEGVRLLCGLAAIAGIALVAFYLGQLVHDLVRPDKD